MPLEQQAQAAFYLFWAAFLSGIIGYERERKDRAAGLRTHMLVGVGSCLFTLLSIHAFGDSDAGRVAANVIVGIGFLGAGTIIVRDNRPHFLTTGAGIWATAAVGMAVGTGAWFLALVAALAIWFILAILIRTEPPKPEDS